VVVKPAYVNAALVTKTQAWVFNVLKCYIETSFYIMMFIF